MSNVLKGKPVADKISEGLIQEVEVLKEKGITPKLAILRVGARGDDLAYEKGALSRCAKIGIDTEVKEFPEDITQEDFIEALRKTNGDPSIHGILIFRPLPKQLNEDVIKYEIAAEKDIDCLSPINAAKLLEGDDTGFPPCTPMAVIEILKHYEVQMEGKKAVVLGRSMVVGKPAALLLLKENATVTICHSRTKELSSVTKEGDILVAAIGKDRFVKEDFIKEGAVVIDVGINVDAEGNMYGDVDFEGCKEKAGMITPVPAGVGSVTTSILAKHVLKACRLQHNIY
ncbi:bifunctional 5,10-methylenetetrahydrofolate dehydrogenase/5,10-methenyltetrahydrofolate cyclohydrolase [Alkaliphilus oremlandii]|uniref:Bifunctional protein FolD n=1 Tax=Alkaliphilus oremlandii (strain OhILAs) TaxID=350688 RepID=FOLD_ALKOO|nr:tetrahydrofolate dehydrogenase/cyclohydrolase catalytic domain-containing protein [Alkaliphilus oremlandii]A8MKZ5.1 RecName: Full=Bifunctional protein FolD; Includes: RecName: Full=Methylenetetrahydrofolate dehydrogenase; Includes: RecName: Full=Methenyltetrahydrofolate cyclohydrolase [Alkaliphilus oremlandii OhILAs]ABW17812.1 Methylenetetrahydrofolate dehydrogenase (NADP(+)) [Alkaliphilus oremlandii OhILAs]